MKPTVVIAPNKDTASREKLANLLSAQGASTAPVQHPTQALARLMQAYVGGEIRNDITTQNDQRKSDARNTLQDALAAYRGDTPNYSDQGPTQPVQGTGADRDALAQVMQQNPDTADLVNQSDLSRILAGGSNFKVPTGYQKTASGGVEQIPGWLNTGRYKPVSYTDENGNIINAMVDVAHIAGAGGPTPMGGQQTQPGQPSVGPGGMVNLGTKKEKTMTVEAGSKAAMMQQGMKDLQSAQPLLFDENGSINRFNATNAWLNTPGTDGRLVYSYYFNAINAKLRAESGAAVPEEEVKRGLKVFMPSPFDNDKTGQEKIVRLQEFMNSALTNMDATGRLVPQNAELAAWMSQEEKKVQQYESLPKPQTQADFDALPKGSMYVDPDDGQRYIK